MTCIRQTFTLIILLVLVGCSTLPTQQHPKSALEQYKIALKAMKAGKNDKAINYFVKMTQDYPSFAGPYANLGLLYQRQNLKKEAAEAFDKAMSLQPQSAEIYNSAGIFYRSVGRFDDAEAAYLNAVKNSPDYAEPILNLAILYDLYLKQPENAIKYYKRYLSLTKKPDGKVGLWLADLQRRTTK